ncbi:MAG: hypothetical protein ACKV2O_19840 [Acidimicrobiales bacterium]
MRFKPDENLGRSALDAFRNAGPSKVGRVIATLLAAVEHHDIEGSLWIVRPDRVRVRRPTLPDGA